MTFTTSPGVMCGEPPRPFELTFLHSLNGTPASAKVNHLLPRRGTNERTPANVNCLFFIEIESPFPYHHPHFSSLPGLSIVWVSEAAEKVLKVFSEVISVAGGHCVLAQECTLFVDDFGRKQSFLFVDFT